MEGPKIGNSNLKLVNKMFPILRRGRKREGVEIQSTFSQHFQLFRGVRGKASWNYSNFDRSFLDFLWCSDMAVWTKPSPWSIKKYYNFVFLWGGSSFESIMHTNIFLIFQIRHPKYKPKISCFGKVKLVACGAHKVHQQSRLFFSLCSKTH